MVDAEDLVHSTRSVMSEVCRRSGIVAAGLQLEEEPAPMKAWPKDEVTREFAKVLLSSKRATGQNDEACGFCHDGVLVMG